MTRIMISCGEPSGDLYAGALVGEIRRREPDVEVFGFGGEHLEAAGGELVGDFRGIAATGIAEVLKLLPRTWRLYRRLVATARTRRPDVLVAIDFPDFNFRLARAAKALGIPVVYYISPQLWAWRPGRIRTIRKVADQVLVIFPFEEPLYRTAGVPVSFVGHPLVELTTVREMPHAFLSRLGLDPTVPTVALLPGSRGNELRAILPDLADAARLIARQMPRVQFVLARAPRLDASLFAPVTMGRAIGAPLIIVEGQTNEVLAAADVVLTASGTATVQAALHDCPMVIVYRLPRFEFKVVRPFMKIDTFGMPNLVAGEKIAAELIQDDFTPQAVAREALALLTDEARVAHARAGLLEVRRRLGEPGASGRAAEAVLAMAHRTGTPSR